MSPEKLEVDPFKGEHCTLTMLRRRCNEFNPAESGVCGLDDCLWIGRGRSFRGKTTLRVSLLDIEESAGKEYPYYGFEEIEVLYGVNRQTSEFVWFLMEKDALRRAMESGEVYICH